LYQSSQLLSWSHHQLLSQKPVTPARLEPAITSAMPATVPAITSTTSHSIYNASHYLSHQSRQLRFKPAVSHPRQVQLQPISPSRQLWDTNTTEDPDTTTTTSTAYGSECNYPVSFSVNHSITQKTFTTTHGAEMVAIGMSLAA